MIARLEAPERADHRWPSAFVDVATGRGISEAGRAITFQPFPAGGHIEDVLSALLSLPTAVTAPIWRLYLTGTLPGEETGQPVSEEGDWIADDDITPKDNDDLPDAPPDRRLATLLQYLCDVDSTSGWGMDDHAGYPSTSKPSASVVHYRHRGTGQRVIVATVRPWFGSGPADLATPDEARNVFRAIEHQLTERFHNHWLRGTPGRTGLAALGQTWDERGIEPVRLPNDLRELLHHEIHQGRHHLLDVPSDGVMLPVGAVLLDRAWCYAATSRNIGSGPARRDRDPTFAGAFVPAFYSIRFVVPDWWPYRTGVFAVKAGPRPTDGWRYPWHPGEVGTCWASNSELRSAFWPAPHLCPVCEAGFRGEAVIACPQHSWPITIHERILLHTGMGIYQSSRGPLDLWGERLSAIRETDIPRLARSGGLSPHEATLAAKAIRAVLLAGIGSLHRSQRPRRVIVPAGTDLPTGIHNPERLSLRRGGQVILLNVPARLDTNADPWFTRFDHPELSAQTWGNTRASLGLSRVGGGYVGWQTVEPGSLVSTEGDSLLLTHDPGWQDTRARGHFRSKGILREPAPLPKTWAELQALKNTMEIPA